MDFLLTGDEVNNFAWVAIALLVVSVVGKLAVWFAWRGRAYKKANPVPRGTPFMAIHDRGYRPSSSFIPMRAAGHARNDDTEVSLFSAGPDPASLFI
jgi:hypothetical protein